MESTPAHDGNSKNQSRYFHALEAMFLVELKQKTRRGSESSPTEAECLISLTQLTAVPTEMWLMRRY